MNQEGDLLGGHHRAMLRGQGGNAGMLFDSESSQFLHFLLKLQSISFLSFLSSFLSLFFSLSLFFYFIENFAIIGAIPDLMRRISLGIRG